MNTSTIKSKASKRNTKFEIRGVNHLALTCKDMKRTVDFYSGVLGMKETGHYHNDKIDETMLKFDGDNEPTLVLVHYADNRKIELGTAYGNLLFVTPDIKGLVGKLRAGGYKVPKDPAVSTQMGIIVGFAEDPEGRPIELVEMLKK